ncbi:MAG TPA: serine/threonine-protein kinase [Planctomycetaceae bacterium]|nr:serine/threonine-protein kinase [Planctomycetaceae bacterium]
MTVTTQIDELFRQWEQMLYAGQLLPAEELCSGCPELTTELERRIKSFVTERQQQATECLPGTLDEKANAPTRDEIIFSVGQYGRFRFHARGGLGEVFVAGDQELNRDVALKFIQRAHEGDTDSKTQFLLEAEVAARLEHPGIVPVYGMGQTSDGRPFHVMRFIRGDTLADAIAEFHRPERAGRSEDERNVEFRKLLGRFISVCNTIAYAHNRGILHRDIKPDNIMLGKYGETLIVDWGLAMPVERDDQARASGEPTLRPGSGETESSYSGGPAGTPSYMSPEQAAGSPDVGPSSDIFSLGSTLYKLLTGESPFQGTHTRDILEKVKTGRFPSPRTVRPEVPRPLEAVCLKAMCHNPGGRYATALDLANDLECWLADEPVSAYREGWTDRVRRAARRHRSWAVSAVAAVAIVVVVAVAAAAMMGRSAHREHAARQSSEQAREQMVRMAARLGASAVAGELESRLRILELAAADVDLHELLEALAAAREQGPEAERAAWSEVQLRIQEWLRGVEETHRSSTRDAQWFLTDDRGFQVARVPLLDGKRTIGVGYAYRDYFHGEGRDFPENSDTSARRPIQHPHRSIVFQNRGDRKLNAALSVPVIARGVGPGGPRVLGVLCMTVGVGDSSMLHLETGEDLMAVLVDTRPDWKGRQGLVLQHPSLADGQEVLLDAAKVAELERLRSRSEAGLERGYLDPVAPEAGPAWLAAFQPVIVEGYDGALRDTGWVVIVQQRDGEVGGE